MAIQCRDDGPSIHDSVLTTVQNERQCIMFTGRRNYILITYVFFLFSSYTIPATTSEAS